MDMTLERIKAGEEIEVIDGPDDICAPMMGKRFKHCSRKTVIARYQAAVQDLHALLAINLCPGQRIELDDATVQSLCLRGV